MFQKNQQTIRLAPHSDNYVRQIEYTKLLSQQLIILEEHNIPREILEHFKELQPKAVKHAASTTSPIGECIMIPVIPRAVIPLAVQMSMLRIGRRHGFSQLHQDVINNTIATLNPVVEQPYYIVDVDFGLRQGDIAPNDLNTILLQSFPRRRRGLTPEEAIALAIFSGLHQHYNIYCAASEYLNMIPIIAQKTVPLDARSDDEPNDTLERVVQPVLARSDPRMHDSKKKIPTCDVSIFSW